MGFEPKKVQNVDRWSSLINPVASGNGNGVTSAGAAGPLFYNLAPKDEFTRGAEDAYKKMVGGRVSFADPAENAPPPSPFKGLSRFGR